MVSVSVGSSSVAPREIGTRLRRASGTEAGFLDTGEAAKDVPPRVPQPGDTGASGTCL
jgi:hypothetical protein